MPLFSYTAITTSGNELSGKQQSVDQATAIEQLRERGLRIVEISASGSKGGFGGEENFSDWLASQRSVTQKALIFFFKQMSFMLRAGLSVTEAFELSRTQISNARLKLTVKKMLRDIEGGQAISLAMKKHPDVFPDMAINLLVAGESTGDLDTIMDRLSLHLEKKAALRAQMINAMIYPVFVVLAAIGVAVFMVVKIIPKFAEFLLSQGKPLPPSTQALIDTAAFIQTNGFYLLGGAIAFIIFLFVSYKTDRGQLMLDKIFLRIPVMGSMITIGSMGQLTWALSILLASGVTVFDALKVTSNLIGNRVFSDKLMSASDRILLGKDLATSLQHPRIPELVTQMIAVGERTGSVDAILQQMGSYYEQQLDTAVKALSAMIEPAMIVVIGGMVGFVYYAFFQALFSLVG